ncbi:glycosyltransferase family 2 protein [Candidatus Woesebacteria bacterium]|nr:glycosyltransferase family 2 protein [Candidatus Woesebacteria bacterium]
MVAPKEIFILRKVFLKGVKRPKVSVIILSWNRKDDTLETINSLAKSNIRDFVLEIYVVDNGSTDGSEIAIKKLLAKIGSPPSLLTRMTELNDNLGFAGGNNVGIRYALKHGADYVMILNNDTVVSPSLIVRTVELLQKNTRVGLVSPKIYFAKGFEFHKERYKEKDKGRVIWYGGGKIDWDNVYGSGRGVDEVDNGQYDRMQETDFATGTCMFITRKALEEVGMFDEKYFMYYEDTDLSVRAKRAGFKVIYVPEAVVWHKVAQSSAIGSELNDYFTARNRMLFGMKYASLRTKLALFRQSINLLLNGRKWEKIGIKDFYLGKFGKGSWPPAQRASGPEGK